MISQGAGKGGGGADSTLVMWDAGRVEHLKIEYSNEPLAPAAETQYKLIIPRFSYSNPFCCPPAVPFHLAFSLLFPTVCHMTVPCTFFALREQTFSQRDSRCTSDWIPSNVVYCRELTYGDPRSEIDTHLI